MLTNDDKKWIAAQMSARTVASEDPVGARIGMYEERLGARLERFEATLIAEFQKWKLPAIDPRVEAAALRAMDLELEGLREDRHDR